MDKELIDKLLEGYQKPEDLIGENGLLKQLTKAGPPDLRVRRLARRPIPHQPARRSRHAAASYHADFKLASEAVILPALRRGDRRRIPEVPRIRESVPH